VNRCLTHIAPVLYTGSPHKVSSLQEKQGSGPVLRMTNALKGRTCLTYLGYSWRWSCHHLHVTENHQVNDSLHITHFSPMRQLAPFLQNRGDMENTISPRNKKSEW